MPCTANTSSEARKNESRTIGNIAAAQPIHAVLIGVAGIAADHAHVVIEKIFRILHLDRPRTASHQTGQAVDFDMMGFERADAMPVRLLHPAVVVIGILRAVIDDDAAAEDLDVVDLPEIDAAHDHRARRQIVGLAALRIEAPFMEARPDDVVARRGCGFFVGDRRGMRDKDKQHLGVVQEIARPRDGEFDGVFNLELDGPSVARGTNPEAPGLNIDAIVPEAVFVGGDGEAEAGGGLDVDVVIAGGGVGYVDGLAVDLDGVFKGAQFLRYRNRHHAKIGKECEAQPCRSERNRGGENQNGKEYTKAAE